MTQTQQMDLCPNGHPRTVENSYFGSGGRRCRQCRKEVDRHRKNFKAAKRKGTCRFGHDVTQPDSYYMRTDGAKRCRVCMELRLAEAKKSRGRVEPGTELLAKIEITKHEGSPYWTCGGHIFGRGNTLTCECGTHFNEHQKDPKPCRLILERLGVQV